MQVAPVYTPPPLPLGDLPDPVSSEFGITGNVAHIGDPEGRGRRYFEGWCSLVGIDWQDEDVPPEVFAAAVEAFLQKNPVVLWDHRRYLPIGRVESITVDLDRGAYVRGVIYRYDEAVRRFKGMPGEASKFPAAESIAAKCDEVWALMRSGETLGISWSGRARRRYKWAPELQQYCPCPVEILIHEITITPIQTHPGAKVTGLDTLAKSLEIITKALPTAPQRKEAAMSERLKQLQAAQQEYLKRLHDLPDDVELPDDILETEAAISKSLGLGGEDDEDGEDEGDGTISKSLEEIRAENAALQARLAALEGKPAPMRRRVTTHTPSGSQPKPGTANEGGLIEKALEAGATVYRGRTDFGEGDPCHLSVHDTMRLWMAKHSDRIKGGRHITLSPNGQRYLSSLQQ